MNAADEMVIELKKPTVLLVGYAVMVLLLSALLLMPPKGWGAQNLSTKLCLVFMLASVPIALSVALAYARKPTFRLTIGSRGLTFPSASPGRPDIALPYGELRAASWYGWRSGARVVLKTDANTYMIRGLPADFPPPRVVEMVNQRRRLGA